MELDDINLPVRIAELLATALAGVGLDLPLVVSQAFALVLFGAALFWGLGKIRTEGPGRLLGLLLSIGFGLGILGVAAGWAQALLAPLPTQVTGQVEIISDTRGLSLADVRVELLDFRGNNIALEPGIVDSQSGFFVLSYIPEFGDRPRAIRTSAAGCSDIDTPIGRSRLRREASFLVRVSCEPQT